jgi:site-specific DNA-methyltransferase (adenine-specific)
LLPGNPRRGDVDAVCRSYSVFGQRKPIVARRTGERDGRPVGIVIAGNHQMMAAEKLGWPEIAVVWTDDDEMTARAFALADNRTSELGVFDEEALAEMLGEVSSDAELLAAASYTEQDLQELLGGVAPKGRNDSDEAPGVPDEPRSRLGDLWLLGEHRVLCGDAEDRAALDRLTDGETVGCVLTDPPYGISLDTDYTKMQSSSSTSFLGASVNSKRWRPVAGDGVPFDASPLRTYFAAVREQFWFGADYYHRTLTEDDRDGSWLVWDKRNESSDEGFGSGFELVWSATRHKRNLLRHYYFGYLGAEARNRVHPTQKPTALLAEILSRWTPQGCVVADPFAGSGSTLIAAHGLGRKARCVELDPRYVDVICRRYQEHTGEKPVLEASGEQHDFMEDKNAATAGASGQVSLCR